MSTLTCLKRFWPFGKRKKETGKIRVYRYLGSHGLQTLKDGRLLTSRFTDLNDPFELLQRLDGKMDVKLLKSHLPELRKKFGPEYNQLFNDLEAGHPDTQRVLDQFNAISLAEIKSEMERVQKIADESIRTLCFSKTDVNQYDEVLLWSHYARKHKHIRIGFEIDANDPRLMEVLYFKDREPVKISEALKPPSAYKEEADPSTRVANSIKRKSVGWHYENEVRMVFPLRDPSIESSFNEELKRQVEYFHFSPEQVFGVDFGIKCDDDTAREISGILDKQFPHAEKRKAKIHPDEYRILYESI